MPDYRRNRVPGGTFFFTVNLRDRSLDLLVTRIDALRDAVRSTLAAAPVHIDAWVVLPDHMHCIWTLPPGDSNFPLRWHGIKSRFSKLCTADGVVGADVGPKGYRGIWQRGYWEHTIRDEQDYAAHIDYTHFNPVKHGYVNEPADWALSSFRRCVARGMYPLGWEPGGGSEGVLEAGERR